MRHRNLATDEQGFASITIAIILILVLSLTTVGFADLMRTEQRQALDRQLSSQAYYAAESGINDATKAIDNGYKAEKTACGVADQGGLKGVDTDEPGNEYLASNVIGNAADGVSYPCLLINPTPTSLEYTSIDTGQPKTVEMTGIGSDGSTQAIDSIKFSWQDSGSNQTFAPNCNTFYPASGGTGGNWTYTGLLRVQVIPLNFYTRDSLINNSPTLFLCPNGGDGSSGSVAYLDSIGNERNGNLVNGNCKTGTLPRWCNAKLTGLDPSDTSLHQSTFFINMRSIYSPVSVTVTAYDRNGDQLRIANAQTLVDSTGKAQDVLRRLQVRIPTHSNYPTAANGTSATNDVCKQLDLWPYNGTSGC